MLWGDSFKSFRYRAPEITRAFMLLVQDASPCIPVMSCILLLAMSSCCVSYHICCKEMLLDHGRHKICHNTCLRLRRCWVVGRSVTKKIVRIMNQAIQYYFVLALPLYLKSMWQKRGINRLLMFKTSNLKASAVVAPNICWPRWYHGF